MTRPQLDLVPLHSAVRADAPTVLDVLLRITPPAPEPMPDRPALNLALVLDRSGSMASHNKLDYARQAAAFAVGQLRPDDRVSITAFDHQVHTLVPNVPAADRGRIAELIGTIEPGGSTALHDGWRAGGAQAAAHRVAGGLNRVLLLSDGLANVGETRPDAIANDVHRLAAEGVSTSTLGLGDDYNEDLLEAMAHSGDGNYYYVENPEQLPAIFNSELHGLMATRGSAVRLGVAPGAGVAVAEVLNDLERAADGTWALPNLVAGLPILVVVRLEVAPGTGTRELCRCTLAWSAPGEGERPEVRAVLALPAVPAAAWETLAPDVEVQERAALLLIARLKKAAARCVEQGDLDGARPRLAEIRRILAGLPASAEVEREHAALAQIEAHIESGAWMKFSKAAKYQTYQRRSTRPNP